MTDSTPATAPPQDQPDPPALAAALKGLNHYEFRPLSDGSGIQVSQSGKAVLLDWMTVLNLGSALIDAYRRKVEADA